DISAKKEVANNADLTFRSFNGDLTFTYNFFYNKVHNYLYQANTGLTMDDLHAEHADEIADEHDDHADFAIYQYLQQDATLYGLEVEARYQINNTQAVTLFADKVRAKLDSGGNLPRIPPVKIGIGYHYTGLNWSGDFGATYYAKQNNISIYETSTDAYTLLDASLSYDLAWSNWDSRLFLRATNLTNELALVHSSFIKDDAPLPGRAITLGIRATF
ncbi:MAG TPA: TonB-dependent receptor, partial [Rheinheimera sp.]|nr:TonB-dependent receptor [Rheinheimera sp.]